MNETMKKMAYILGCAYNDHDFDGISCVIDWLEALSKDAADEKTIKDINQTYEDYTREDDLD